MLVFSADYKLKLAPCGEAMLRLVFPGGIAVASEVSS